LLAVSHCPAHHGRDIHPRHLGRRKELETMTNLLSPTEQAIAAVVVAVFVGLIVAHVVWIAIKKLQRWQDERQATADMDAKLAAKYECHMTEEQRKQMNAERWNGD
jgi:large-conductance mechanosensitive channel